MADVVVIGSGVGGLAAAIDLAARGASVTVFEAGPRPGGKADIVEIDGVEVDTGPSVLTLPEVIDELLQHAGTSLDAELTLVRPEPAFRYLYPDGCALDVYLEAERTAASVEATLGSEARADFEAFGDYARRIWGGVGGRVRVRRRPVVVADPRPGTQGVARAGPDRRGTNRCGRRSAAACGIHGCGGCSPATPPTTARIPGSHPRR